MRNLLVAGLLSVSVPVAATTVKTVDEPISSQKVIEIKGVELPSLVGQTYAPFTLFALQQGILVPIPHQCEDFDDQGYSWFKESKTPLRGTAGTLDLHDSLFFRFADAGTRMQNHSATLSQQMTEIEVKDGNATRYVYVSKSPQGFSHTPLAHYDQETGKISTDFFTLQTDPDNLLQWGDFTYKHFQGLPNNTLLDTLKLRVEAGVILSNARVTLDNQDLNTHVVAVKEGPVRTVILANSTMNFAGVPVVYLDMQFQLYPQQISIDAKVEVPAILKRLLKEPTATVSLDGRNLIGSELRSSVAPQSVIVDGKMTPEEKALGKHSIHQNAWVWLSSHKGFDIFSTLYIPPNFNVPVTLHYEDSLTDEDTPERYSGQGPNVGYHMTDVPVNDTFHFAFQAFFTDTLAGTPPEQLGAALANVPQVITRPLGRSVDLVQHMPPEGSL